MEQISLGFPETIAPFKFKSKKRYDPSNKYYQRKLLQEKKDKKRLRRIVRLRKIHLDRYISVKYRGTKWWEKTIAYYYDDITQEEIVACKQNSTSEIIGTLSNFHPSLSYTSIFIKNRNPQIFDPKLVRILFHGHTQEMDLNIFQLVAYRCEKQGVDDEDCFIVQVGERLPPNEKLPIIKGKNLEREHACRAGYRVDYSLNYQKSTRQQSLILDCLTYEQALKRHKYQSIDNELSLLEKKLSQIHNQNLCFWDRAIFNYYIEMDDQNHLREVSSEIQELERRNACRERLLYFRKGWADKTEDQLEQALKELEVEQKRLVLSRRGKGRLASYNDCKVCFYPDVKQNNPIVFCNACFTSFHINCYGLPFEIDTDNFICDPCHFMLQKDLEFMDMQNRPICEICFTHRQFPLKKIGQCFYHVSCLFIFQLVSPTTLPISLKQTVTHSKIQTLYQKSQKCNYCIPNHDDTGMKLKCWAPRCVVTYHPICGYLRGCQFKITRESQLQIQSKCDFHTFNCQQDEEIRQVYLRRFFCNYGNIQKLNEQQFKPLYRSQKNQIQLAINKVYRGIEEQEEEVNLVKRQKQNQSEVDLPMSQRESSDVYQSSSINEVPTLREDVLSACS